ncbi:MAG: response regulator transcription factor [Ignavibacteriae bacterium]|nr:response regulator transcription factor [Ignavibacteriota bacterium]
MPINVAIVEDKREIREGLTFLINSSEGYKCIGSFDNAEDGLAEIPKKHADVVLMDINLPNMNGIECVRKLKAEMPSVQVIMLTVYEDTDRIFESLKAGASGYLLKRTPPSKIIEWIGDAHRGGSPMSSEIARKVVQSFQKNNHPKPDELDELSAREKEILTFLSKGFTYKEIGDQLFISDETVRSHLRRIYEKLQVHSRTEAVVKFLTR